MKITLAALFSLISSLSHGAIEAKWEKMKTDRAVEIFQGEVKGSQIVAFRGLSVIDAPLSKVISVVYDVSRMKEWMSDLKEINVLARTSKMEKTEYNRTNAPWPVSDRDFVYTVIAKVNELDKSIEITIESVKHPKAPEIKGVVRGELHSSRYFMKALANGKTHIEVEILANPKGSLPKWVVNFFQSSWPTNTINGIRRIAMEDGYKIHPDLVGDLSRL